MKRQPKPVLAMLLLSGFILLIILLMQPWEVFRFKENIALLFPDGKIALKERDLLLIIQAIMLLVVIPVYVLTFIFSWKYRADGKGKYTPDWEHNRLAEILWWGIPFVIIIVIGILTGIRTYQMDPFKPLKSDKEPQNIQVVALQWKWLFIYPKEGIAVVNFVQFPEKTPLNFEITSDAPMNSFWIPRLGSQIYAMPKMRTKVHLIADEKGDFRGSSANISGKGFAGMHFIARASSDEDFKSWVASAKRSAKVLTLDEYNKLAEPSENNPVTIYRLQEDNLFEEIIMKYMHPPKEQR